MKENRKAQNSYSVVINGYDNEKAEYDFCYDYSSIKDIKLFFVQGKAKICFSMQTKKNFEDFINFSIKPFKDAYKKVYMLHALLYGKGLDVKKIEIMINDEHKEFDDSDEGFPFLFSMLEDKELNIEAPWKNVAKEYCTLTKTKLENDYRYTALYAFLMSKSREYEYDRFQNLWTSVNAVYSKVAKYFDKSVKKKVDLKLLKKKKDTKKPTKPPFLIAGIEQKCIGALSFIIGGNYKKITPDKSKKFWKEYFDIETTIGKIDESKYPEFYKECKKGLSKDIKKGSEEYLKLKPLADSFEVPVYVLLILGYPYYWRCKYLHGNYIVPLFMAHNDADFCCLKIINYFMERFLSEEIPKMFKDDYWNDEKYDAVIQMLKKCYEDDYKNYEKVLKKQPQN